MINQELLEEEMLLDDLVKKLAIHLQEQVRFLVKNNCTQKRFVICYVWR